VIDTTVYTLQGSHCQGLYLRAALIVLNSNLMLYPFLSLDLPFALASGTLLILIF